MYLKSDVYQDDKWIQSDMMQIQIKQNEMILPVVPLGTNSSGRSCAYSFLLFLLGFVIYISKPAASQT